MAESHRSAPSSSSPGSSASALPPDLQKALETDSMPELLGQLFPPLQTYCPILPLVSPPQSLFLLLDCFEALYGGAVGGGKTAALLMGAIQYVDVPGYAALIMRRTFPELEQPDGPIDQSLRWFAQAPDDVRPRYNRADHEWLFPSGAKIKFGHLDNPNAMIQYQGGGYHYFGFDELTHFDEQPYEFIAFSRARRPKHGPLAQVPMRVRASANPGGPGHGWVKPRFITQRKPDVAFIPAKLADNPGIDQDDYIGRLRQMRPALIQQLLEGDWDAFEDQAYALVDDHLVDEFPLTESHDRFEAADYGFAGAPWGLWAVDYEGNLIAFDMLYERDRLPSELAQLVVEKRKHGWGFGHTAFMDPSVWKRTYGRNRWGRPAMLSDEFLENGVPIEPANNDPRAGMARLRELLKLDPAHRFPAWHPRRGEPGAPRLFFVRSTTEPLVAELQAAPVQPLDRSDGGEKVNPEWESRSGHAAAMARYAVMTRPYPSTAPPVPIDDPRQALLASYIKKRDRPAPQPRYIDV